MLNSLVYSDSNWLHSVWEHRERIRWRNLNILVSPEQAERFFYENVYRIWYLEKFLSSCTYITTYLNNFLTYKGWSNIITLCSLEICRLNKSTAKLGSRHNPKVKKKKTHQKSKLNRCHKSQSICIPKVFTPILFAFSLHIRSVNLFTWLSHF